MEVLEEIIFGKGYCLVDTNNIGALRDIQEQLINLVCKHKKLQEVTDIEGFRKKLKSRLRGRRVLLDSPDEARVPVLGFPTFFPIGKGMQRGKVMIDSLHQCPSN